MCRDGNGNSKAVSIRYVKGVLLPMEYCKSPYMFSAQRYRGMSFCERLTRVDSHVSHVRIVCFPSVLGPITPPSFSPILTSIQRTTFGFG